MLPALTRPSTFLSAMQLPAAEDGIVGLAAEGLDRLLLHVHDVRGVDDLDAAGRNRAGGGSSGSSWAWSPTRTTERSGTACDGQHRPGHDRSRAVIAAHRVERDPHGLLSLLLVFHDDLAALVVTAVRADAVRQDRLVAPRQNWICTGVSAWWLRRVPCLEWDVRLLGTAMTISRYFYTRKRVKTVILGPRRGGVKPLTRRGISTTERVSLIVGPTAGRTGRRAGGFSFWEEDGGPSLGAMAAVVHCDIKGQASRRRRVFYLLAPRVKRITAET